jgi:sporulation protein YlmC with PRC-barrel domain
MRTTLALALMGAALISVPATAQTAGSADNTRTNTAAAPAPTGSASPLFEMKAGQWRATKLTGVSVYDPRNEKIGDINELIIGRDGRVAAVVVGVGGCLGIGEHNSAIPFDQVQWRDEPLNRNVAGGPGGNNTGMTGTSTPAPADRAAMDRPAGAASGERTVATDTHVDQRTGTAVTTTTTERPVGTTTTADRRDARDAYRGYPDHAVVNMTKDQLKALPEVRYTR